MISWIKKRLNSSEDESNKEKEKNEFLTEINQNDFDVAIKRVQPSSKREGFATVPDVTWDDVGALQNVREELATAILVTRLKSCLIVIINYFHKNFNVLGIS